MPRHHETNGRQEHLKDLLHHRVQRVSEDALERGAALFHCRHNAGETSLSQDDAGGGLRHIGGGGDGNTDLRLAQGERIMGAIAARADRGSAFPEGFGPREVLICFAPRGPIGLRWNALELSTVAQPFGASFERINKKSIGGFPYPSLLS